MGIHHKGVGCNIGEWTKSWARGNESGKLSLRVDDPCEVCRIFRPAITTEDCSWLTKKRQRYEQRNWHCTFQICHGHHHRHHHHHHHYHHQQQQQHLFVRFCMFTYLKSVHMNHIESSWEGYVPSPSTNQIYQCLRSFGAAPVKEIIGTLSPDCPDCQSTVWSQFVLGKTTQLRQHCIFPWHRKSQ